MARSLDHPTCPTRTCVAGERWGKWRWAGDPFQTWPPVGRQGAVRRRRGVRWHGSSHSPIFRASKVGMVPKRDGLCIHWGKADEGPSAGRVTWALPSGGAGARGKAWRDADEKARVFVSPAVRLPQQPRSTAPDLWTASPRPTHPPTGWADSWRRRRRARGAGEAPRRAAPRKKCAGGRGTPRRGLRPATCPPRRRGPRPSLRQLRQLRPRGGLRGGSGEAMPRGREGGAPGPRPPACPFAYLTAAWVRDSGQFPLAFRRYEGAAAEPGRHFQFRSSRADLRVLAPGLGPVNSHASWACTWRRPADVRTAARTGQLPRRAQFR
eukprot:scaffold4121_cov381-Prasinococcus_capsulatus_cf.AAC.2